MKTASVRRALIAEGLLKEASNVQIGVLSATIDGDNRYGSSLTAWWVGSQVEIRKREWFPRGGMDGPGGIESDGTQVLARVADDGRSVAQAVLKAIKADPTLSRYGKASKFEWSLGFDRQVIKGVSVEKAQMALDSWEMDKPEWDLKWAKPAKAPAAGPFDLSGKTDMAGVIPVFQAQGYKFVPIDRGMAGYLENGRQANRFENDLLASADSRKFNTDYSFGPVTIRFKKERTFDAKTRSWGPKWVVRVVK